MSLIVAASPLALAPCQRDDAGGSASEIRPVEVLCSAKGGRFAQAGLWGNETSFKPTQDASKTSAANMQCDGFRLASDDMPGRGQDLTQVLQSGCID